MLKVSIEYFPTKIIMDCEDIFKWKILFPWGPGPRSGTRHGGVGLGTNVKQKQIDGQVNKVGYLVDRKITIQPKKQNSVKHHI